MSLTTFLLRVLEALLLGGLVGTERQMHHSMAGLRTNALVATGACLFMTVVELVPGLGREGARMAAQIVSGIGFLGAGVIMRDGLNVRGLNTAATLWCSSAVGVLSGMGLFEAAALGAAAILGANLLLPRLAGGVDRLSGNAQNETGYRMDIVCGQSDVSRLRSLLLERIEARGLSLLELRTRDLDGSRVGIAASVGASAKEAAAVEAVVAWVGQETGVVSAGWKATEDQR